MSSVLEAEDADLICLQEVTPRFLGSFLSSPWLQRNYIVSDTAAGMTVTPYGVFMAIHRRIPTPKLRLYALPTNMGRRCLSATFQLEADRSLAVATVHLESMANTDMRMAQLKIILPLLEQKEADLSLLCGDFNFAPHHCEQDVLDENKEFVDTWAHLRPSDPGFTMHGSPVRIDRMIARTLQPHSIDFLGCDELNGHPGVHPSDHKGLVATFNIPQ